jgi:hypothetical protein
MRFSLRHSRDSCLSELQRAKACNAAAEFCAFNLRIGQIMLPGDPSVREGIAGKSAAFEVLVAPLSSNPPICSL